MPEYRDSGILNQGWEAKAAKAFTATERNKAVEDYLAVQADKLNSVRQVSDQERAAFMRGVAQGVCSGSPAPEPEVQSQLNRFNNDLNVLHNTIDRLEKRLESVIRPLPEISDDPNQCSPSPLCRLATRLREIDRDIVSASNRLDGLVARIEL